MSRYEKALGPHEEKTLLVILRKRPNVAIKVVVSRKTAMAATPSTKCRWLNHKEDVC